MSVSLSEVVQTLLSGSTLSWTKFGPYRAGSIQLTSSGARRLFHFLLSCDPSKAANAEEDLFKGLIAAWQNTSFDPALGAKLGAAATYTGTWRLVRVESAGFGGLNVLDGPNFTLSLDGENWCLEGQNGSGKTSLASAIIWALTGYRCRDQDGVIAEDGRRAPVFNDSGVQIGDWPPLVAYPATPRKLAGSAEAWVRLTFENEKGDTAQAFRHLIAPVAGEPVFEQSIDPVLLSAPQLLETGLLMPARLSRIGFGDRSKSIYEAVKLLTGLDQLADIGEGAANFTHKGKRFLKYAEDNGSRVLETRIQLALKRAAEEAVKATFELKLSHKREDKAYAHELRDIAKHAAEQAGTHLSVLASDVTKGLDTNKLADRTKIKNAVAAARGILQQDAKGVVIFDAWTALDAAYSEATFQGIPAVLAKVKMELNDAVMWDKRQAQDAKLRLKALASQYFTASDHTHADAECPLCESKLSGEKRKALAVELLELKKAAAAAERKLKDACAELEKMIRDLLPVGISSRFQLLARMQPRDALETAALERFAQDPPFSTILTGMAAFARQGAKTLASSLPVFEVAEKPTVTELSPAATDLLTYMQDVERIASLAAWWNANRCPFLQGWKTLRGVADAEGKFPTTSLEGKLASLEAALEMAAPLDELAKALEDAALAAEKWLVIHAQQVVREAIAEALEPLRDLRAVVASETASSISALSGRIKSVLDRIHFKERLSFEEAALSKKSVLVSGSFDHGIRIDASTVANTSWMRAILWAFVLALREQTIEGLGANPFPLTVLDDPQVTFDPRKQKKVGGRNCAARQCEQDC